MNISPYQKVLGYFLLFCLLLAAAFLFISLFITHKEQPVFYGTFFVLFLMIIGLILTGYLQVRDAYKQGSIKNWYQQSEITVGLAFFFFLLVFPDVSLFNVVFRIHPLRSIYYLEMSTLFFLLLLSLIFFALYLKSKFDEERKK